MQIREISTADLPAVTAILHEGFPRRKLVEWRAAIANLMRRPEVPGFPRFGFAIDADGSIQGVILLLTADFADGIRSNLSSWYVRANYRKFATFLFQRVLKTKATVFLNLSPSDRALPIATAFGFRPYTAGAIFLDARAALGGTAGWVAATRSDGLGFLPEPLRDRAESHIAYGCSALRLRNSSGESVALYRIKRLKGVIPCAQFVFGDPERLVALSGPLMRALLKQGVPAAMIDSDGSENAGAGRFMKGRWIRYVRGTAPPVGDLLETELAVFGP